jgi:hypothetical protein
LAGVIILKNIATIINNLLPKEQASLEDFWATVVSVNYPKTGLKAKKL